MSALTSYALAPVVSLMDYLVDCCCGGRENKRKRFLPTTPPRLLDDAQLERWPPPPDSATKAVRASTRTGSTFALESDAHGPNASPRRPNKGTHWDANFQLSKPVHNQLMHEELQRTRSERSVPQSSAVDFVFRGARSLEVTMRSDTTSTFTSVLVSKKRQMQQGPAFV